MTPRCDQDRLTHPESAKAKGYDHVFVVIAQIPVRNERGAFPPPLFVQFAAARASVSQPSKVARLSAIHLSARPQIASVVLAPLEISNA